MFFLHQFTSFFEDVLECIGPGWKCEANLFFFLFLMIVALYPFGLWSLYGYGSIPIDTFLVGWTSIYQLFWGSLGTRVLTHPHMMISLWFLPATKTADRDEPPSATAPRCRCANLRLVAQIAWQAHQLWQFVIWMTVWAPRMLKWDWNGIEMGMDQNLSPHVTYVTLYLGTLPAILVWRPGDSTGFDRSGIMKELLGMNGDQSDTDYDGEAPLRRFCGRWERW